MLQVNEWYMSDKYIDNVFRLVRIVRFDKKLNFWVDNLDNYYDDDCNMRTSDGHVIGRLQEANTNEIISELLDRVNKLEAAIGNIHERLSCNDNM